MSRFRAARRALDRCAQLVDAAHHQIGDGQDAAVLDEPVGEANQIGATIDVPGKQEDVGTPVSRILGESSELQDRRSHQRHEGSAAQVSPRGGEGPAPHEEIDADFEQQGDREGNGVDQIHRPEASEGSRQ